MSNVERKLESITTGRLASLAMQELAPLLREQRDATIVRLIQDFRAGKREELYAHIAVLVAVEDLENNARSKIRMGESAAREMNNGK